MKGLILAGGHGTRLRPLTYTGNKHMLPIANQPILFYGLRHLAQAGIKEVAIILGPINEGIREGVGDGRAFGLHIEYITQGHPKGLAHAVLCAQEFLGDDPFLMYLGDNLLQTGVEPFVNLYQSTPTDAVLGATPVPDPRTFGVVEMAGDKILSIEEKPVLPKSNLALIGVYLFGPAIHPIIRGLTPSRRGELEITDAIWQLWKKTGRVSVLRLDGWWKDTGQPSDLLDANSLVLNSMPAASFAVEGMIEGGAIVEGPVSVGRGSLVDSDSTIIGPVILGAGVRVTGRSTIGPGCSVGDRAFVSRSTITRSIIMEGARLDGVHVRESLIGRNAEVVCGAGRGNELRLILGDSSRVIL